MVWSRKTSRFSSTKVASLPAAPDEPTKHIALDLHPANRFRFSRCLNMTQRPEWVSGGNCPMNRPDIAWWKAYARRAAVDDR